MNPRINEKPPLNIMKYTQLYLVFTLVFYFIGPVQWQTQNTVWMVLLVIIYQLAFLSGYNRRINQPLKPAVNIVGEKDFTVRHFGLFSIITIALNLLLLVRISMNYGIGSLGQMFLMSFTDPTSLYHATTETTISSQMYGGSGLAIINALASPITFAIIPMGFILFKELNFKNKILFIAAAVTTVLSSLCTGRGEGILRIAIFAMVWFLLRGNHDSVSTKKADNKRRIGQIILLVAVLVIFLYAYSALMHNRTLGSYHLPIGSNTIDYDNILFKILPEGMRDLMVYLHIYLTQGYFGMSICLDKAWNPTFFCGFSPWFRTEVEELLGIDLKAGTFMAQATDSGWKYGTNWHTAYSWFACDVWWIGVAIIMFLMGELLADSYKDAYFNHNPLSIGMVTLLLMFIFYLPANNYIFADSDTFICFFVYLILLKVRFVVRR